MIKGVKVDWGFILKVVEVGAFLPSCHSFLNNHSDEVKSKVVLPTAWLVNKSKRIVVVYFLNTCSTLYYLFTIVFFSYHLSYLTQSF